LAPSHVVAPQIGDHRNLVTPGGASTVPAGSNNQHRPLRDLTSRDASRTSSLVEAETTAPVAARTFGTTTDVVFPDRGGPITSSADSGRAKTQRPLLAPTKNGWLATGPPQ
jgi:hypothetical protein